MNNIIEILPYALIAILLFITLVAYLEKKTKKNYQRHNEILDGLEEQIALKKHQLETLTEQFNTQNTDRKTNLTITQTQVLDNYEKSNIRIPIEIIEDLEYNRITDKKEIEKFIENQRYYWKLENTKKPFKGGEN